METEALKYTVQLRYVEVYTLTVIADSPEDADCKATAFLEAGCLPKTYGEWATVVTGFEEV